MVPKDLSVRSWVESDPDMRTEWPVELRMDTLRRCYVDWTRTWAKVKRVQRPRKPTQGTGSRLNDRRLIARDGSMGDAGFPAYGCHRPRAARLLEAFGDDLTV